MVEKEQERKQNYQIY